MHRWYVIQTKSGTEQKVARDLTGRLRAARLSSAVREIVVPEEDSTKVNASGQKVMVRSKLMPGYMLICCRMAEAYSVVKGTKNVLGFLGNGGGDDAEPVALTESEAAEWLGRKPGAKPGKPVQQAFEVGQDVRILNGAMADFQGKVTEFVPGAGKATIEVVVFGRATPVEVAITDLGRI